MEKVAIASTASKAAVKRLIDDLNTAQDVLNEARNKIAKGFKDLREDQDTFAAENGVLDVDGSEILYINAGGGHDVCDPRHPDPYQGVEAGGSVQWALGQAPAKGRRW